MSSFLLGWDHHGCFGTRPIYVTARSATGESSGCRRDDGLSEKHTFFVSAWCSTVLYAEPRELSLADLVGRRPRLTPGRLVAKISSKTHT